MISALTLTHIQYTQLDSATWCATAQVATAQVSSLSNVIHTKEIWRRSYWWSVSRLSNTELTQLSDHHWQYVADDRPSSRRSSARQQRQLQCQGVRQLLQTLLETLDIDDTLNESSFPYRLNHSGYYVCFSHTNAHYHKNIDKNMSQRIRNTLCSRVAVVICHHRPAGIDIESNNVAWHVAKRFYSDHEMTVLQTLPISQRDHAVKWLWQIKESFIKVHQYTLVQGLGMDYSDLIPSLTDSMNKNLLSIQRTDHHSDYQIAVLPSYQTVVIF